MIFLVGFVVVIFVIINYMTVRELNSIFNKERQKWYEERQILLNRIENPKYMPPIGTAGKQANMDEIRRLREETEAFGLVGKIVD